MTVAVKTRAALIPLFLIAMGVVGIENALTRYFAVAKWSEYGYWIISIVMAGFALSGVVVDEEAKGQITLATRYFDLRVEIEHGDARAVRTALIELPQAGPARTVIQRWTLDE